MRKSREKLIPIFGALFLVFGLILLIFSGYDYEQDFEGPKSETNNSQPAE